MKILGVDVGTRRTGVAVCDKSEILASPLKTIKEDDRVKLVDKIIDAANDNRVKMIIIGHPINMDGSRGERAKDCEHIAKLIETKSKFEVKLWDERRTTKQAYQYLNYCNTKRQNKKKVVDEAAATIILENFLEYRRQKKQKEIFKRNF